MLFRQKIFHLNLLALVLRFGAVTLIFGGTIITVPLATYFSYRKDQHALGDMKK